MESVFPFARSLEANCHLRSFSILANCLPTSSFSSLMSPRGLASDQKPLPRLITTPRPAITMTHWLVLEPPPVLRAATLTSLHGHLSHGGLPSSAEASAAAVSKSE